MTDLALVPTRVGMILCHFYTPLPPRTCPHTRGDDPQRLAEVAAYMDLSPHAWG